MLFTALNITCLEHVLEEDLEDLAEASGVMSWTGKYGIFAICACSTCTVPVLYQGTVCATSKYPYCFFPHFLADISVSCLDEMSPQHYFGYLKKPPERCLVGDDVYLRFCPDHLDSKFAQAVVCGTTLSSANQHCRY